MASRTEAAMPSSSRAQSAVSDAPIARRSRAKSTATSLVIERLDTERAVGQLRELLHLRLGLAERAGGVAQAGDPFLEQGERAGELQLLVLQLRHDLLEARDPALDGHAVPRGSGRTALARDSTSPSR